MSQLEKGNKKKSIVILIIILVVVIGVMGVIFLFTNQNKNGSKAEQAMTKLVTEYYEQNIKGKVTGINRQKITLQALENAGFDISTVNSKGEYDKGKAYSLVIVENPDETDPNKINYKVENHLDGK